MTHNLLPLTKQTFLHMGKTWCSVLNRHESASIINFSARTQAYRIDQFIEQYPHQRKLKDSENIQFLILNIASLAIDFEGNLLTFLKKKRDSRKTRLIIFIINADLLLTDYRELLNAFNNLAVKNFEYSIFYFFQQNILYSWVRRKYTGYSSLFQNCFVENLMNKRDDEQFIKYLSKRSRVAIPPSAKDTIRLLSGGRMLLTSELVRQYAKKKSINEALNADELQKKIHILWQELLPIEQDVLKKIINQQTNFSKEECEALEFLVKTHFIIPKKNKFTISVQLLETYLKSKKDKTQLEANARSEVFINRVNMTHLFSERERHFIVRLIQKKNEFISREEAGEIFWKSNYYTDWALDQIVSRLRKKLSALHLLDVHIITLKKHGYQLEVK